MLPAARAKTPAAVAIDLAAAPGQLSPALATTEAEILKGATKVVVTNFRVILISESDATGTASAGLGGSGSASQTVVYTLGNLNSGKLEAMADELYVSWQDSLKAAGYEVQPMSVVQGKAGFERLGPDASLARFQMIEMGGKIAMMVTPAAVPIKLPVGAFATDAQGRKIEGAVATGSDAAKVAAATGKGGMLGKFGALGGAAAGLTKTAKGFGSVTSAIGDAGPLAKLSEAVGAALVDVTLVLNFVDLEASGGGFLERIAGSTTASVKGKVQPTLVATDTRLHLLQGIKSATVTLKRPVVLAGDAISEVRDATTGMDKAGNIAGAVVGGVLALETGRGTHSSKINRKEAVAGPNYSDVVRDNLALVGKAMAGSMRPN